MRKQTALIFGGILIAELAAVFALSFFVSLPELAVSQPAPEQDTSTVSLYLGMLVVAGAVLLLRVAYTNSSYWVKEDERTHSVGQRAASYVYIAAVTQLAIASLLFKFLSTPGSVWEYISTTLSVVIVFMVAIYVVTYFIINRGMQKDG